MDQFGFIPFPFLILMLDVLVLAVVFLVGVVLKYSIFYIPPGHVIATVKGRYKDSINQDKYMIWNSGIQFIWQLKHPIRYIEWKYKEQDKASGRPVLRTIKGPLICVQRFNIDVLPMDGISRDGVKVTVDGTLQCYIDNPSLAANTVNPIDVLTDGVYGAIRGSIQTKTTKELLVCHFELGNLIKEATNKNMMHVDAGITCTSFIVQSITMPKAIQEADEINMANSRQYENNKLELERRLTLDVSHHNLAMQKAEQEHEAACKKERRRHTLATQIVDQSLEIQRKELDCKRELAEAEVAILSMKWDAEISKCKSLREAGFSGSDIVTLESLPHLEKIMGKGDKWFLGTAPSAFTPLFSPLLSEAGRHPLPINQRISDVH